MISLFLYDALTLLGVFILTTILDRKKLNLRTVSGAVFFSVILSFFSGKYNSLILFLAWLSYLVLLVTSRKLLSTNKLFTFTLACIIQSFLGQLSTWIVHIISFNLSENLQAYISIVLNYVLIYFMVMLYRRFSNLIIILESKYRYNRQYKIIYSVFLLLISVLLIAINVVSDMYKITATFQGLIIFTFFITLCSTGYFLFIVTRAIELESRFQLDAEQLKNFEKYKAVAEQNYSNMIKFKHDYKNILTSLGVFVNNSENEEFKNYFNKLVEYSDSELNLQDSYLNKVSKINSVPIQSILLSKIQIAKSNNILVNLEIDKDVKILLIDDIILARLLSILLDNAIEESKNQVKKEISIAIITYKNNNFDLIVQNKISTTTDIDINSWFTEHYSTKGITHGQGLKTLNTIISSNPDLSFEVSLDKNSVSTILMVGEN